MSEHHPGQRPDDRPTGHRPDDRPTEPGPTGHQPGDSRGATGERPSDLWRRQVSTQTAQITAGQLTPDKAYAAELWPPDFIAAVDLALTAYEDDVREFSPTSSDHDIWTAVERVVLALNEVDDYIETDEREQLAAYVHDVLVGAGVDVTAVAGRRGLHPAELTDQWRDW
ncbi:translation initiation factor IF-2 [Actinoplanes sp. SE50]|uniref:hypothetical protein n=1 Tax=unclassified Actinoplanes TaxID=2626549 RepID=UPI00023EC2D4|nr:MULTISPECIES: hypothetical protein [unclassified Actinoplanes]AEV85232.1 Translation initiation factor IF-2 [Actinoplanes sp. SE50/110]ATO83627.1 translation initiation factor IF-2 [Actinoplanes sp. SE50]SLM01035.1 hypothetical protein ACSP50_4268 [Actinoplanes sp. SE50/110]